MGWNDWIRTVEVEPSLYAADFSRLGEQIEVLLRAGARVFHFDIGDGHFVEPITIGPIVLQWISPIIHAGDGYIDCHLMTETPEKHFAQIKRAGGDSVTVHYEACPDLPSVVLEARSLDLQIGLAFKPETSAAYAAHAAISSGVDMVLCMSIEPGYSGQEFMPEAFDRIRTVRSVLPEHVHVQVDGGIGPGERQGRARRGRIALRGGHVDLRPRGPPACLPQAPRRVEMSLERALELAERGRGTTYPNPVVGAVVVRDGEVVGEGWHQRKGEAHAEVIALAAAGERAKGATLFVTMEPCAHHGSTPPCTEAVLAAGVAKVVAGSLDPNPEAGGGLDVLRAAGVETEDAGLAAARIQNEAWRVWVAEKRPFVILKLAVTLDGRVAVPGTRWVTGEEVAPARARAACAGRRGRGRHGDGARGRSAADCAGCRRGASSRGDSRSAVGRFPDGSELELRTGGLEDELATLAAEGVQSLLLEGGPKLAESFLRAGPRRQGAVVRRTADRRQRSLVCSRTARAGRAAAFRQSSKSVTISC